MDQRAEHLARDMGAQEKKLFGVALEIAALIDGHKLTNAEGISVLVCCLKADTENTPVWHFLGAEILALYCKWRSILAAAEAAKAGGISHPLH